VLQFDRSQDAVPSISGLRLTSPDPATARQAAAARAAAELAELAGTSGGRVEPATTAERAIAGFRVMDDELRRQYVLYFYPSDTAPDGRVRQLRVAVDRPGVTVRARAAYRVGSDRGGAK
jgi:hypothetical protein